MIQIKTGQIIMYKKDQLYLLRMQNMYIMDHRTLRPELLIIYIPRYINVHFCLTFARSTKINASPGRYTNGYKWQVFHIYVSFLKGRFHAETKTVICHSPPTNCACNLDNSESRIKPTLQLKFQVLRYIRINEFQGLKPSALSRRI